MEILQDTDKIKIENIINVPALQQGFGVINRCQLTRKEHLKLLSTPKGAHFKISRKLSNQSEKSFHECKLETQKTSPVETICTCGDNRYGGPRKCKPKRRRKRSLKPCDQANPYLNNFLADMWSHLTPDAIDSLKEMLTKEFGLQPREAEDFLLNQGLKTMSKTPNKSKRETNLPCFQSLPLTSNEIPCPLPCFPTPQKLPSPPPDFPCPPLKLPSLPSNFPCIPKFCFPPPEPPCPPPNFPCIPKFCFPPPEPPCPPPNFPCIPKFCCPPPDFPFPPCPSPPLYPCTSPDKISLNKNSKYSRKRKLRKRKQLGLRHYWAKLFNNDLTIKLNDYIVMILSQRRSKRVRCISEVILKHLCDITGELCTLNMARTRAQKIMVFIADRIAIWLANISCECDDEVREICRKNNLKNNEGDDEDESEGEELNEKESSERNKFKRKVGENRSNEKEANLSQGEPSNKSSEEVENTRDPTDVPQDIESIKIINKLSTMHLSRAAKTTEQNFYTKQSRHLIRSGYQEIRLLSEKELEEDLAIKEQAKVNEVLNDVIHEIKQTEHFTMSERAKGLSLILNDKLENKITSKDEITSEIINNVSKSFGNWIDKAIVEAEKEYLIHIPTEIQNEKKPFYINKSIYQDIDLLIKLISSELNSQQLRDLGTQDRVKDVDDYVQIKNSSVNPESLYKSRIKESTYSSNSIISANQTLGGPWIDVLNPEAIDKSKKPNEEVIKWEHDLNDHAMRWSENNFFLKRASQMWNAQKSDTQLFEWKYGLQNHGIQWKQNNGLLLEEAKKKLLSRD